MKIAVASGKGGTGKTTVSAALMAVWPGPVIGVDLDVEEPNLHLFLNPDISGSAVSTMKVPVIDDSLCTSCGMCSELCQFKAISVLGDIVMTFPEMCHGCGGCMAVCPEGAITEGARELGRISWGHCKYGAFLMGELRVSEAMSPPLMRDVKKYLSGMLKKDGADAILDAPPGVSCPAMNAVMDSDVILLVTEPTPFGLYDLKLAHHAFSPLNIPMGLIVNRAGLGNDDVYAYAKEAGLPVLAKIPHDRGIAEAYARGSIISGHSPALHRLFSDLAQRVLLIGGPERVITVSEVAKCSR